MFECERIFVAITISIVVPCQWCRCDVNDISGHWWCSHFPVCTLNFQLNGKVHCISLLYHFTSFRRDKLHTEWKWRTNENNSFILYTILELLRFFCALHTDSEQQLLLLVASYFFFCASDVNLFIFSQFFFHVFMFTLHNVHSDWIAHGTDTTHTAKRLRHIRMSR